jgi:hypothetical protein
VTDVLAELPIEVDQGRVDGGKRSGSGDTIHNYQTEFGMVSLRQEKPWKGG